MKKNYQVPETLIIELEVSNYILEDSGEIGNGQGDDPTPGHLTNDAKIFEDDIPTGTSSSLWD
ncbi:MAG: hypothetical protein IKR05_06430 [Prevotella sp.]|nr:hypothetical protein [Prevotella sp.]